MSKKKIIFLIALLSTLGLLLFVLSSKISVKEEKNISADDLNLSKEIYDENYDQANRVTSPRFLTEDKKEYQIRVNELLIIKLNDEYKFKESSANILFKEGEDLKTFRTNPSLTATEEGNGYITFQRNSNDVTFIIKVVKGEIINYDVINPGSVTTSEPPTTVIGSDVTIVDPAEPVEDTAKRVKEITDLLDSLKGGSEDVVSKVLKSNGIVFRVTKRDSEEFALTMDYSETRANLVFVSDKLVGYTLG